MALTHPSASAVAGTQIGRFTLLGKLAEGGMAEVFLARQEGPMGFAKTVVIKRILPEHAGDEQFLRMFLDEARLAALINHPHVVSILELGEDPVAKSFFMAMEYIDGRNLKQVANRALELGSQLSMRVGARLIADACAGLDFAHNLRDPSGTPLRLVHRDISAENILLSYAGMVKVVDFGIAKAAHLEGRTRTGQVKGKFSYMAPEQLLGQPVDRRADVWALGITLYWLLSGQRPFRGTSEGQVIQQVVSAELPRLRRRGTQVAPELEEVVRTALERDPDKRFQSAAELQSALELWLARTGEPVTSNSLGLLMNQIFPEATDKDRVLTRALLQGDIQSQDTPWKARIAKQPEGSFQVSAGRHRARMLRLWLVAAGLIGALAVGGVVFLRTNGQIDSTVLAESPPAPPHPATGAIAPHVPSEPPSAAQRPLTDMPAVTTAPAAPVVPAARPPAAPPNGGLADEAKVRRPAYVRAHHGGGPGRLDIEVRPWASVSIDGRPVGVTPFAPVSLTAGRHRVELDNGDLGAKVTRTVDIRAGETETLREKLTAPE